MAGDVKISYGSTGFEKVNEELIQLERTGGGAHAWFKPLQSSLIEAERAGESFVSKLSSGLQSVASVAGGVVGEIAKIAVGITAVTGVIGGAATIAFASWSKSILTTTESFRMLEISLYGALKSWESVNKVSEFAKKYSAEYPAMYKDVMQAMQSFAYIPSMKPMLEKGDVTEMKKMMDIVQALTTMRPEQGTQGALFALREALSGNWRSLQMRFDLPIESIAKAGGMTMEQMTKSPAKAIKALEAFTGEFVGVDTMAMMAKNLGTQVDNLREKYNLWKESIGKAGFYDKVINYLLKLNEAFENLLKSETLEKITKQISSFMESIADKIAWIFTEGINWEGITDMKGALEAFRKVGQNAMDALREAWEVAKGPVSDALKGVITFGAEVAIDAAKDLFIPVGESIAAGIIVGLEQGMKEHPFAMMLVGFLTGAAVTPGGPMAKLIGGAVGMEAVALPSQIKTVKSLWQSYDEFMRGMGEQVEDKLGIGRKPESFVAKPYTGPRPWQKPEELAVTPPQAGWIQEWIGSYRPTKTTAPWQMGAEEKFSQYGMWSKMAGQLAAVGEEPEKKTPLSRLINKEIDWATMLRQEKVEAFKGQQMGRLEEIAGMPEAGPEIRGKVFGEMFGLSMAKGDFGKAESYMNKALNEMVLAMKQQAGVVEKDSLNLNAIAGNTGEMVGLLKSTPAESRSIPTKAEEWSEDELRYEVRNALRES